MAVHTSRRGYRAQWYKDTAHYAKMHKVRVDYTEKTQVGLGVFKWLRTMRSASCVVTSTFHGVLFSILLHKQFVAVSKPTSKLRVLLESVGLSDRVAETNETAGMLWPAQRIDYGTLSKELLRRRDLSLSWLRAAVIDAAVTGSTRAS